MVNNRFFSLSLSLYCTLMLTSSYMSAGQTFSSASFGGAAAALESKIQELNTAGWSEAAAPALSEAPANVAGQAIQTEPAATTVEPLAIAAALAQKSTTTTTMPKTLCQHFGLTDGTVSLSYYTLKGNTGDYAKRFHVTKEPDAKDIIIVVRIGTEHTFYLTSPDGVLRAALYWKKESPVQDIAITVAQAGFDKEKAYWIERVGSGSAGNLGSGK